MFVQEHFQFIKEQKISKDEYHFFDSLKDFYGKNLIFTKFPKVKIKSTSENRYYFRIQKWEYFIFAKYEKYSFIYKLIARFYHHFWWLIHNLVAHPILAFGLNEYKLARKFRLPTKTAKFHDWTSEKLNLEESKSQFVPNPKNKKWWVIHNFIIHPLIGLFPCKSTFKWHDKSAELMSDMFWI